MAWQFGNSSTCPDCGNKAFTMGSDLKYCSQCRTHYCDDKRNLPPGETVVEVVLALLMPFRRCMNDTLKLLLRLLFAILAWCALAAIPFLLCRRFGPCSGLAATIAAFPVWRFLGPPPSPGFLNGIVCLIGIAGLLGVLINWVVLIYRHHLG